MAEEKRWQWIGRTLTVFSFMLALNIWIFVFYIYQIDKRLDKIEQNIVQVEQEKNK